MFIKWLKAYLSRDKYQVRAYLVDKNNTIRLIIFTAIFSLCFINIYRPFDSTTWYNVSMLYYFFFSSLLVLTGILVIAASRYAMYRFVQSHSMHYIEYVLWIISEILVLSIFYTIYTISAHDDRSWWNVTDVIITFEEVNMKTILVIMLPYIVSWLYFSNVDKRNRIRKMLQKEHTSSSHAVISFTDEKGEFKFSVTTTQIIYIESADNYVDIAYLNQGKLTHYLLRNTLKRLSTTVLKDTTIKRCHRSRMVNFGHVEALRKQSNVLYLVMDVSGVEMLPVSKSYQDEVTEFFLHYKEDEAIVE